MDLRKQYEQTVASINAMTHLSKMERKDRISHCKRIMENAEIELEDTGKLPARILAANEKSAEVVEKKLKAKAQRLKAERAVGLDILDDVDSDGADV